MPNWPCPYQHFIWRERLSIGTVPTVKMHPVGTVPTVKMHPVGTVPTDKMHPVGTVPTDKMHPVGSVPTDKMHPLWTVILSSSTFWAKIWIVQQKKWLLVAFIKLSRSDNQSWKSIPRSYWVNRVSIGWNHWLCLNLIRLTLVKFIRPLITIHEAKNSNSKVQALSGLYPSFSVFYLPIISLYLYLPHTCL